MLRKSHFYIELKFFLVEWCSWLLMNLMYVRILKGELFMRNTLKKSMLLICAVVMLISSSVPCMAATVTEENQTYSTRSRIIFDGSGSNKLQLSTSYKTIAHVDTSSSSGMNARIVIIVPNNTEFCPNDIRMLDRNDNVVWEEFGAIDYTGIRSFDCGSNVYTVQIKAQSGSGWAYAGLVAE